MSPDNLLDLPKIKTLLVSRSVASLVVASSSFASP